jgi:hypothetical protein
MIKQHPAPQTTPQLLCSSSIRNPNGHGRYGSLMLRGARLYRHPYIDKPRNIPPAPTHHPSRPALGSNLSNARCHQSTARRVHRPRASYTPTASHHHCWQLRASLHTTALSPRQPIPPTRSQPTHRACAALQISTNTGVCMIRPRVVHVAAAEGHVVSLRWFSSDPAGSAAVLCVCVYGTPRCTAESSRGCGGNARTSLLLDWRGRRE